MRALWEKKLLQKFSGQITHYRVRVHRAGVSDRLFPQSSSMLKTYFLFFTFSHLPETLSLTGRVHSCWKISVLKFCTCFSMCSNTIFGIELFFYGRLGLEKWMGRQLQVRARATDRREFEWIFRYLDLASYHLFTKIPECFWTHALSYHIKCFIPPYFQCKTWIWVSFCLQINPNLKKSF